MGRPPWVAPALGSSCPPSPCEVAQSRRGFPDSHSIFPPASAPPRRGEPGAVSPLPVSSQEINPWKIG